MEWRGRPSCSRFLTLVCIWYNYRGIQMFTHKYKVPKRTKSCTSTSLFSRKLFLWRFVLACSFGRNQEIINVYVHTCICTPTAMCASFMICTYIIWEHREATQNKRFRAFFSKIAGELRQATPLRLQHPQHSLAKLLGLPLNWVFLLSSRLGIPPHTCTCWPL